MTPVLRIAFALACLGLPAEAERVLVQSTTSTANSGLYDHILPIFTEATGIEVDVVAVGTGQAIRNARNCDGDVLLVHAREAEEQFVTDGFGIARHDLMFNDFVLVGPEGDPAGVADARNANDALDRIAANEALFASRGDDSGTHMKERALWRAAGVDPSGASGTWYRETGSGMGATLNTAVGMGAYALTDRATWSAFGNRGDHGIVFQGDPDLRNPYGVIAVSPARCPTVNTKAAQAFVDWLLSAPGQSAIAGHRIGGEQLFFPDAR